MFTSAPLGSHSAKLEGFDSGARDLDEWLRVHAAGAQARRTARTFVWCASDGDVVAYYSLAGHVLVRDALPRSASRGSPAQIPAVLIAKLALDRRLHGRGNGSALLADALGRVVEAARTVAARFVVVDALHPEAAAFYEHHGFVQVPGSLRLIQKINDIAAALAPE